MLKSPRLDAIVYRTGGSNPCYVSEHGGSQSRDNDFYQSLSKLRSLVQEDLDSGCYPPASFRFGRPFVTCVDTVLPLRDGERAQPFFSCSYEAEDYRGRKGFVSFCPTNYLSNSGKALLDSFSALGEVIEARYLDESVADLMRELPRTPFVTTFDLYDRGPSTREVSAIIQHDEGSFVAFSPDLEPRFRASDPYDALAGLERVLAEDPSAARGHILNAEPVFGSLDVQLSLRGSFSIHRFLISVAPSKNGTRYYRAYAPQAGVTSKSLTIEGAVHNIKDAIALRFHGAGLADVENALRSRPILTTARLGSENNN
jgi:predicted RNase H-like HicB family nuclease